MLPVLAMRPGQAKDSLLVQPVRALSLASQLPQKSASAFGKGGRVPGGCAIDVNVFFLLRQKRGIERAQRYRNPVGKLVLRP